MTLLSFFLACAACYGQSDSPLAAGMNWAIMSLLGVIGIVLCGVTTFFVYLVKKSANSAAQPPSVSTDASKPGSSDNNSPSL